MPAGHPQFFTTIRVFKPRVVNIRMFVYPHVSRAYVSRDASSMQSTVCATIKNIAADLFSVFLNTDGNIRGSSCLN